ncbi:MAG: hypothetical protein IPG89_10130 [Bacteroidetes bacterium]|nr:hypothetical protein [Bacteroidota bacterium]
MYKPLSTLAAFGNTFTYLKLVAIVLCLICVSSCNNLDNKLPPFENKSGVGVQSVDLNLKSKYLVNSFLNETIVPVLNSEGKPIATGKPIPVISKPLQIKNPLVTEFKLLLKYRITIIPMLQRKNKLYP